MANRSEPPWEGDVSAPALCQELLVLHLLFHHSMSPDLMLSVCPAQVKSHTHCSQSHIEDPLRQFYFYLELNVKQTKKTVYV